MGILQGEVYEITIAALMQSVPTFNLHKGIKRSIKLLLVCRKVQEPLNLEDYKVYINNIRETSISASDKESSIDAASPQLTLGICAATIFQQALMNPPESQFIRSPGFSDKSHNCAYARKVIALNKAFDIFLGAYCLDTFTFLVFTTETIDKIVHCYSRLPLA